jgi:hypothetical protein
MKSGKRNRTANMQLRHVEVYNNYVFICNLYGATIRNRNLIGMGDAETSYSV